MSQIKEFLLTLFPCHEQDLLVDMNLSFPFLYVKPYLMCGVPHTRTVLINHYMLLYSVICWLVVVVATDNCVIDENNTPRKCVVVRVVHVHLFVDLVN